MTSTTVIGGFALSVELVVALIMSRMCHGSLQLSLTSRFVQLSSGGGR